MKICMEIFRVLLFLIIFLIENNYKRVDVYILNKYIL